MTTRRLVFYRDDGPACPACGGTMVEYFMGDDGVATAQCLSCNRVERFRVNAVAVTDILVANHHGARAMGGVFDELHEAHGV